MVCVYQATIIWLFFIQHSCRHVLAYPTARKAVPPLVSLMDEPLQVSESSSSSPQRSFSTSETRTTELATSTSTHNAGHSVAKASIVSPMPSISTLHARPTIDSNLQSLRIPRAEPTGAIAVAVVSTMKTGIPTSIAHSYDDNNSEAKELHITITTERQNMSSAINLSLKIAKIMALVIFIAIAWT